MGDSFTLADFIDPGKREREDRRAARQLIAGLETLAGEALSLGRDATADGAANAFAAYRRFRDKYDDYRALVSLIRTRLEVLERDKAALLHEEFRRLDAFMLVLLARTAAGFFKAFAGAGEIPLGAREILQPDLQLLAETGGQLRAPGYADLADAATQDLLDAAARDLAAVIARLPELPDFSRAGGLLPPLRRR